MSIGDFVSKTVSEALGRIIAQAPKQFMALATSAVVCKKEISAFLGRLLIAHLKEVGTLLYGEPVRYSFGASETYIDGIAGVQVVPVVELRQAT